MKRAEKTKARRPWAKYLTSWYLNPLTPYRTQNKNCPCNLEACLTLTELNEWTPHALETHNKWELKDYLVTSLMLGLFQSKLEETMISPSERIYGLQWKPSQSSMLMTKIKKITAWASSTSGPELFTAVWQLAMFKSLACKLYPYSVYCCVSHICAIKLAVAIISRERSLAWEIPLPY